MFIGRGSRLKLDQYVHTIIHIYDTKLSPVTSPTGEARVCLFEIVERLVPQESSDAEPPVVQRPAMTQPLAYLTHVCVVARRADLGIDYMIASPGAVEHVYTVGGVQLGRPLVGRVRLLLFVFAGAHQYQSIALAQRRCTVAWAARASARRSVESHLGVGSQRK